VAAESGAAQEYLRIYLENGLTPTLQGSSHKIPAIPNCIKVVMASASVGVIYVSMVDRLNIYAINGLTAPLKLVTSFPLPSGGQFFRVRRANNGNLVCALGTAGVAIFAPTGRMVAQLVPTSLTIPYWTRLTNFALNDLMRPTPDGTFSAQRYYFKATTGGSSGWFEPSWSLTGTTGDGSVVWTPQAIAGPVVTDIAVDQARNRIYATGTTGGVKGTNGRVWSFTAKGLI